MINEKLIPDTGWIDLTPSTGTWSYLRYRVIGKTVYVEGYASSFKYSGSATEIVSTANAIPQQYRPSEIKYVYASCGGRRIARFYITADGRIGDDWTCDISNGNLYTTAIWHHFHTSYVID